MVDNVHHFTLTKLLCCRYWDIRGIVTPIRLLLHYADVQYEYKAYSLENIDPWYKEDKIQLQDTLDFPNVPYYIDDKVKLTHVNFQ